MPQHRNSQSCQGYVNPAQLYSAFPVVYDQDMNGQHQYDTYSSADTPMPMRPFFAGGLFDDKAVRAWEEEPMNYSAPSSWPAENRAPTPGLRDDCSGSSVSDSPSPGNTTSQQQQGQSHKRRAQNRAAQRAYRDRKVRYLLDLQSGIQDIEQKIRRLQNENTELIRQLCETRAANNDLRDSSKNKEVILSNDVDIVPSDPSQDGPAEAWSKANLTGVANGELDALYEPFAAMWNLIHLDPSVVRGTVSAQTVLERLRAMVEFSAAKSEIKSPRSYSTSDIPDWPSKTSIAT